MASTTFTTGTVIPVDWLNDVNSVVYTPGTVSAVDVSSTATGNIEATNVQAAIAELEAEKQPLDSDLTAIAALTTASYGRSLLETTSEATFKALVNLESGVDVQAYSANIPTVAPGTVGNVIRSDGSSWTSTAKIGIETPVTASSTAVNFTSVIPAGTKKITLTLNGLSSSGTDNFLVQLGTGGVYATSGYVSCGLGLAPPSTIGAASSTAGFIIYTAVAASDLRGNILLSLHNSTNNIWSCSGVLSDGSANRLVSGTTSLSGSVDSIRIVFTGSNTFDAGTVNILYE